MALAVQLAAGFRPVDRRNFDDRRVLEVRAERDQFAPRQEPVRRFEVIAWPRLSKWMVQPSPAIRTYRRPGSTATQRELLEYAEMRGWQFIGGGVNGSVYASPDGEWVYKRARRNDTTRTFLEWCMWRQQQGRGMRGMPEIDFLADCGEGYVVGMRRYACTFRERKESGADPGFSCMWGLVAPDGHYIRQLLRAFCLDCPGCEADDLHGGNVMWDSRTDDYIVIDPSNGDYAPLGSWHAPEDFQLTLH